MNDFMDAFAARSIEGHITRINSWTDFLHPAWLDKAEAVVCSAKAAQETLRNRTQVGV